MSQTPQKPTSGKTPYRAGRTGAVPGGGLPPQNTASPSGKTPAPLGEPLRKKRKKGLSLGCAIPLILLPILFFVVVGGFSLKYLNETQGKKGGAEVTVQISQGTVTEQIATILQEQKIIKSPFFFRLYVKQSGSAPTFQYGTFKMKEDMPYQDIIKVLQTKTEVRKEVSVTIPEGYTLYQIAQAMEKAGLCKKEEFMDTALKGDFPDIPFLKNLKAPQNVFQVREGYLFPDTYRFFVDESVHSMVKKFFKNFETKVLTADRLQTMQSQNKDLQELITFASLVEWEAGAKEKQKVSAVIHNRLNDAQKFPKLELDATRRYVRDVIGFLMGGEKNVPKAMAEAYNTYVRKGMPVGPICNPGLEAIDAVLHPAAGMEGYYFFVTDLKSGEHLFAKTASEQLANQKKLGIS